MLAMLFVIPSTFYEYHYNCTNAIVLATRKKTVPLQGVQESLV